ncbi:MAG: hypothetical protein QOJ42_4112 [Acidobacteriaceae bacterium]|nr:hypothetical protein [Acidobacteriaceae bacterium]
MPENNVTDPITEGLPRFNPSRDQVLTRLWELANLGPEITRGSITGQVKALAIIISIEGLIPDRHAASARNKPAPPPVTAAIYEAEWLRNQRSAKNADPEPTPPPSNCHPDRSDLSRPAVEAQRRDPRFSQSASGPTPEPTDVESPPSLPPP